MRIICCREVLVKEDRKSLMAQMVMMNDAALKETEVTVKGEGVSKRTQNSMFFNPLFLSLIELNAHKMIEGKLSYTVKLSYEFYLEIPNTITLTKCAIVAKSCLLLCKR